MMGISIVKLVMVDVFSAQAHLPLIANRVHQITTISLLPQLVILNAHLLHSKPPEKNANLAPLSAQFVPIIQPAPNATLPISNSTPQHPLLVYPRALFPIMGIL